MMTPEEKAERQYQKEAEKRRKVLETAVSKAAVLAQALDAASPDGAATVLAIKKATAAATGAYTRPPRAEVKNCTKPPSADSWHARLLPWAALRITAFKTKEEFDDARMALLALVRGHWAMQSARTALCNLLGVKKDGTVMSEKKRPKRNIDANVEKILEQQLASMEASERLTAAAIQTRLEPFAPIVAWLCSISGINLGLAAQLVALIDPYAMRTASCLHQFCGLNTKPVRGKIRVAVKEYRPKMGEIVRHWLAGGEVSHYTVLTDKMISGNRMTKKYLLPYCEDAKTVTIGVIGSSMLKAQGEYAAAFYYPRRTRQENSEKPTTTWVTDPETGKRVPVTIPWSEASDLHHHRDATHVMVRQFLSDLYHVYRSQMGLEVRVPYHEEKLGIVHSGVRVPGAV